MNPSEEEVLAQKAREIARATTARKEAPSGTTLDDRIARASIDVGTFLPDRKNESAKYSYISANQIAARCGDALAREGVVIFPQILEASLNEGTIEYKNGDKKTYHVATIRMRMTVSCSEIPVERDLEWSSVGVDYGSPDKAHAKAITTGVKYFVMKLLSVGIGNEDGEHEDAQQDESAQTAARMPSLDAIAKSIRTQSDFYKVAKRFLAVSRADVARALDGIEPVEWIKAAPGRSKTIALQRILDYSTAQTEEALSS